MNRSRRTGQPLSTIVYELAINGCVREPFTKEEVSMLRSLSGMANNLNQLARQANTYGFQQMAIEVANVVRKVDDLLIKISEK
ncbi:MAG: plasmid mobilization relaxosome protein MobC [Prevotella sp.]|nr:plasmid mobilization relaxosome protein MobC [Prevotella sp.]